MRVFGVPMIDCAQSSRVPRSRELVHEFAGKAPKLPSSPASSGETMNRNDAVTFATAGKSRPSTSSPAAE